MTAAAPRRPRAARAVLLLVGLVAAACSGPPVANSGVPDPAPPSDRLIFVVVGGNETDEGPVSQASAARSWAHQVFTGLPTSAVLLDVSARSADAATTLDRHVPAVVAEKPTVAAVWLGGEDAEDGTPVPSFTTTLAEIVRDLQRGGASRVLLLRRAPNGAMAPYAAAIDEVAAETQSIVVPLPGEDQALSATEVADAVRPYVPA
jgi:hypothetical protein